jgi:hypothetical protein
MLIVNRTPSGACPFAVCKCSFDLAVYCDLALDASSVASLRKELR